MVYHTTKQYNILTYPYYLQGVKLMNSPKLKVLDLHDEIPGGTKNNWRRFNFKSA